MEIFNNREIAIRFWFVILTIWCLTSPPIRKSLRYVLSALTQRLILMSLCLAATYIALLIYSLHEIEIWTTAQLKNTIIWSGAVAAVSLFRIGDIAQDPHYFRTAIKDNLKLVLILEFVVAFFTFSLWIELLIVPFSTFIIVMWAFAQTDKKFAQVERLFDGLTIWIGMGLIFYAAFKLFSDFRSIAQFQTLTDFSLLPILSLLYLPFLFVMALYVNYENAFVRTQFSIDNSSIRSYAKRCAIFAFHFRTEQLKRWVRNLKLIKIENKQDIKKTIREVKTIWEWEKNPDDIPFNLGWSPYVAREFLTKEGLISEDYHRTVGGYDGWHASSTYVQIGKALTNNISYYIEGNETTAKMLKLVMDVNSPEIATEARQQYCAIAEKLFVKAFENEVPQEIIINLSNETEMTAHRNGKEILISKEFWPHSRTKACSIRFIIRNEGYISE